MITLRESGVRFGRRMEHNIITSLMDCDHQSKINKLHLYTYNVNHFCIQLRLPVFVGKIFVFLDTTSQDNFAMMPDLQLKNIIEQHQTDHMQSVDLYHDHQMYPINVMIHLHYQQLPKNVPIPILFHS